MEKGQEERTFSQGEIEEMSVTISPSNHKRYGLQRVCKILGFSRATYYRLKTHGALKKRGPKTALSDAALILKIRKDLASSPFKGEGHRKSHARINRTLQQRIGKNRILRLMRQEKLLSPHRVYQGQKRTHEGKIITDKPNEMWCGDGSKVLTAQDGWVWIFTAVEHWNGECLGHTIVKRGDRFAAMDALLQAVKGVYGCLEKNVAKGLKFRMDHGLQYTSDYFQEQLKYLGIERSMGYVKEPETNGVAERFNRTLKEQIIHGKIYENIGELREEVDKFVRLYNEKWLLAKLSYQSPNEMRKKWLRVA